MRLYHCSDIRLATLEPRLGSHRQQHEAGSPVYVKPVIFFATVLGPAFAPNSATPQRYCHVVEVDADDPDLIDPYPDETAMYGKVDTWALARSIDVIEVYEWDPSLNDLIKCIGIDRLRYEKLACAEYAWLRARLDIGAVPIVFEPYFDEDTKGPRYGFATPRGRGMLYKHLRHRFLGGGLLGHVGRSIFPREITLTFSEGDLSNIHNPVVTPAGGPPTWETIPVDGVLFWEEWRSTLWHEVSHQVEDEGGFGWNPKSGHQHGASWSRAVERMANAFGCQPEKLRKLLESM